MKKIFNLLLVFVMILVLSPEIVDAGSIGKELNGKVYVTDVDSYACDLNPDFKVFKIYKNYIIFYDPDSYASNLGEEILKYLKSDDMYPLYKYNVASDTCTAMNAEEKYNFYSDVYFSSSSSVYISTTYEWGEDNKINQVQTVENYSQVYTKTKDTIVNSEKTYYYLGEENDYIEIDLENLPEDLTIEDFYEIKYYVENYLPILEDTDYYTCSSSAESVVTAVKIESFNDLSDPVFGILMDQEDLIKETYILTADFSKFDKNPIEGATLTKSDLVKVIDISGTKYLLMDINNAFFIYTVDGKFIEYNDSEDPLQFWGLSNFDDFSLLFTDDVEDEDNVVINLMDDKLGVVDLLTVDSEEFEFMSLKSALSYDIYVLFHTGDNNFLRIAIYEPLEGQNQTYNNKELTFKFNGKLNMLDVVLVDGNELNEDDYSTTSGSTIITLGKDFLKTLASGTHTLKVEFTDGGHSSMTFTVGEPNPKTYDGIMTYATLGMISLIGITFVIAYSRKKKLS